MTQMEPAASSQIPFTHISFLPGMYMRTLVDKLVVSIEKSKKRIHQISSSYGNCKLFFASTRLDCSKVPSCKCK